MRVKKQTHILVTVFVLIVVLVFNSCSSDKYNENAMPTDTQNQTTFYPKEIDSVLYNPFMGWVPWAHTAESYAEQPFRLVMASITWKELEPKKGQFDFESIEKKNNFDHWASKGVKIILQFNMDYPDNEKHMDIPDWLYSEIEGKGTWYNYRNENTKMGFSPDYKNEKLIENHKRLISKFAERYDKDPRIFMILIGSCGHWGEWHTTYIEDQKAAGRFPTIEYSNQYVQHYVDYFKNKPLSMRYPSEIGAKNHLGLFNNAFGSYDQTQKWFLDWALYGHQDGYNPGYTHPPMPNFWLDAPSGGEFGYYPGLQWLEDSAMTETLRQARETHISWLGPCCPVQVEVGDKLQPNIDKMMKTMGYRFVIKSVTHADKVKAGNTLKISMDWINKGVAPFYFEWPIELSLVDSSGKIVAKKTTNDDITTILPSEEPTNFTPSLEIPSNLPEGQYKLCAAILDPDTNKPGIQLAIDGKRSDGRYSLSTVDVIRDNVSTPTIKTNTPTKKATAVTPTKLAVASTPTKIASSTPTMKATSTPTNKKDTTPNATTHTATPSLASTSAPTKSTSNSGYVAFDNSAGYQSTPTATTTNTTINYTPPAQPNFPIVTQSKNKESDIEKENRTILFTLNSKLYRVNGIDHIMDATPIIYHNRMLIPVRYISEATGAEVTWIKSQKSVVVKTAKKEIKLWIGKNSALVNGKTVKIDANDASVSPIIVNPGRTMLPLRFITENLGYDVEWQARLKTAKLTSI